MTGARSRRAPRLCALGATALLVLIAVGVSPATPLAAAPPAAPGLSGIALDGKVALAWKPSAGATSYAVYRGTSAGSITDELTPAGFSATSFTDTTAVNGTTYYYEVRASSAGGTSSAGQRAVVTPRARSCSTGNAIVVENCFPGTTAWKTTDGTRAMSHGIEGYLTATSVNAGQSVDLRVMTDWDAPYHVEIYRTGSYGGTQGRLISVIPGLVGQWAPDCDENPTTTGLVDCASWPASATITTTSDWTSGVYLLKLVREDNATTSEALLVVRNDGSTSDLLYGVPTSTYDAYNRWGSKSLYDGLSSPPATVTGGNRAVSVSFDRPFAQPTQDSEAHDWYTRTDVAVISWLESQGYDTTYIASEDLNDDGGQLTRHKVYLSGPHDEYWSQQMFDAVVAARNAGTSIFFLGANAAYWKIRYQSSPISGVADRLVTTYKTIQSGPADPSGIPTTTWRDPAGPNRPENQLIGQMYVGENLTSNFPLQVSTSQGRSRVWRYTSVGNLPPNTTVSIGTGIVGWEWDSRVSNGLEPAGVSTVASTPVNGQILGGNGANQSPGTATQMSTLYKAASGALVFATGTNNWWRGLGLNVHGQGEPDGRIRQATANVLADMGAPPATPSGGVEADPIGPPQVTSTIPASGAGGVVPNAPIKITFDRELDPSTVDDADFEIRAGNGTLVPASASLDNATKTVTLALDDALDPFTGYTVTVGTQIKTWHGDSPSGPYSWSFSSGPGTPPVVTVRSPATGATGVPTDAPITAKFDRRLDAATVTGANFSLRTASGALVGATVDYDSATRTARLVPNTRLAESTQYTATAGTGIQATDGTPMAAPDTWSFTTGVNLKVTSTTPGPLATGISPAAQVRATFSKAIDGTTLTTSSFRLLDGSGSPVPATLTYDGTTRTATLTPSSPLSLLTTYTANVTGAVHATDGAPVDAATWTFTTAPTPPPGPAVTAVTPAAGTTNASNGTRVIAMFDLPVDAPTVSNQSFTLTPDGGSPVAATVAYDAANGRAVLTPAAPLAIGQHYTASLSTQVRSTTGAPLPAAVSWGFTTAQCPCSLMKSLSPAETALPVQDFRPGPGPFSYELGTKITVDQPTTLTALRFYKSAGETGTHVGRVWSSTGTQLASVTFTGESASGWQQQALDSALSLTPGQTYVVSVGLNAFYSKTVSGLATQLNSGPLHSAAVTSNGVYNNAAGQFPASSWLSSNYFVDAVVTLPASPPRTPAVAAVSPLQGSTGVATSSKVTATFNVAMDPSTLTSSTFTLTSSDGASVPAGVSYDEDTQKATLTPSAPLDTGATYTARVSTSVRSDDETALASAFSWSFTTVPPDPPVVTATSPSDAAANITPLTNVQATFSTAMDASTLTTSTVRLEGPGGASVPASVDYDPTTRTVTLDPSGTLDASTTYTGRITTGARSARDVAMVTDTSWTFTTSACPCRLFPNPAQVADTGLDVANGRSGTGPWSLEMGVKITVTQPARLESVRFWKDARETGSHVGRVWAADGSLITSVTFGSETAGPGWQEQDLTTPLALTPGQTYVVSVGLNAAFGMNSGGLASQIVSGPLRSVVGANGVYANAAGTFPNQSWGASNYWVDAVVR